MTWHKTTTGYIYIASPYSHEQELVRAARFWAVCAVSGRLMREGQTVFSPIVHSHPIATLVGMPTDWAFWAAHDEAMIAAAAELWVAMLPGWAASAGLKAEIAIAHRLGKPVVYYQPVEEDLQAGALHMAGLPATVGVGN